MNDEEIRRVLGLLYQDETLKTFASLVLGATDGLPVKALRKLENGGLAACDESGAWRATPERFRDLLRAHAEPAQPLSQEERVLRTFLVDGRLTTTAMRRDKRLVVLRYISRVFEPGVRYPEKDVNVALRAFHDDYAALRRYLVDEELLSREGNVYWRSGGPVEI
uniref:Transcriptional regulator n=1 Tax=Nonomuraea gerenzanensis TaxID=93944 RepID=A0A1M4EHT3_9ACTN|nr:Transcriptional regulator [Nonomuraea gerenzanensis]